MLALHSGFQNFFYDYRKLIFINHKEFGQIDSEAFVHR